jgi:hypothetical protein
VGRTSSKMEKMRNVYKILVDKPEGKKHFRNLRVDGSLMCRMQERVQ